jgi:O-antigen biosynthesis protein
MEFLNERLVPDCYLNDRNLYYWHVSRYDYAKKFVTRDDIILDVACGTGYGTFELATLARKIYGVDIDGQTIKFASQNYSSFNLTFLQHDCLDISKRLTEKIDLCTSFETIEHLTANEQQVFLQEICKLLKKDGILLISTPNKPIYNLQNGSNPYHKHELHHNEFKSLLETYFHSVIILGQHISPNFEYKLAIYKFGAILGAFKKLKFRFKLNEVSPIEISDFEFSNIRIDSSLIFFAICRYPK